MANISYIKGVRTRFRNILETEVQVAKDLITCGYEDDEEIEMGIKVSKCTEKLKSYSEKVKLQSEKLASAVGESESELIEAILDEDCKLCAEARDLYLEVKHYREKMMFDKKKGAVKEEVVDNSTTRQLLELQENMQRLLASQLKQMENVATKSEDSSKVKLLKLT